MKSNETALTVKDQFAVCLLSLVAVTALLLSLAIPMAA